MNSLRVLRDPRLTVGVTTRNRPQSLARCLRSLEMLGALATEIIVVDDSSDVPVAPSLGPLPSPVADKLRVIRQDHAEGYIVARNTIVRLAKNEFVLLMDDDAYLLEAAGLSQAVAIMEQHAEIGAIGCAQAEADGRPWPAPMQPARVAYACRVGAYIGFAHILRRQAFLAAGGYRDELHFYGEEKDFCARLLRAGYQVLYLPDLRVAHIPDPAGRSNARYLRYVVRNDCLFALYNEPWPCASLPIRLARYFAMSRHNPAGDLGGFFWIVSELAAALPRVARGRTPMTWSEHRQWRRLRRQPPAWHPRRQALGPSPEPGTRVTVGVTTKTAS